MSVTRADIGGDVPEDWIDAVNRRLNDLHHQDQCACRGWPDACVTGYKPGRWDEGAVIAVAAAVLEPLIRDRIDAEKQKPTKAVVTRQLKAAGYSQWDGKHTRTVPGFKVAVNRQLTPDGVAVLHMAQFDDPAAMDAALQSYARTLTAFGYEARIEVFAGSLRAVKVRRRRAIEGGKS